MEKCCIIGCESPAVYYNEIKKLKVCVSCKKEYYSNTKFERISDDVNQKQTINTILLYFKNIHEYMKTYPLEGIFKGFGDELKEFEIKTEEFKKKLKIAKDHDLQEEVDSIENDLLKLKEQIDLSEMMKNFTSHQFQTQIERLEKNKKHEEKKEEGIEEDDDIRVTALTKEKISEGFERMYDERISKLNEEYDRENRRLRDEIEKTMIEFEALDKTKNEILKECGELKQREEEIKKANEELKKDKDQTNRVNEDLIRRNNELTNESNNLKQRYNELNCRYEDLNRNYNELNKRNEDLSRRINEVKAEYERQYRAQVEELRSKIYTQNSTIDSKNNEIATYKKTVLDKERKIDKLEEELKLKEIELESIDLHNLPTSILYKYYKNKTGRPITNTYGDSDIIFSLNNDSHKLALSIAKLFKMPSLRKLYIEYCDTPNIDVLEFLKNSITKSVKYLTFGWGHFGEFIPINYYLNGIDNTFKYVTKEIIMNCWAFPIHTLERVVKASCNAEKLVIRHSKIDLDWDLDFSGPSYNINYFCFSCSGSHVGDGWTEHPERLERVIRAFSKCSLKYSLQTFSIVLCGGSVDLKEVFNSYGLYGVKVIEEDNQPKSF